jgi:hypothetical protein
MRPREQHQAARSVTSMWMASKGKDDEAVVRLLQDPSNDAPDRE